MPQKLYGFAASQFIWLTQSFESMRNMRVLWCQSIIKIDAFAEMIVPSDQEACKYDDLHLVLLHVAIKD